MRNKIILSILLISSVFIYLGLVSSVIGPSPTLNVSLVGYFSFNETSGTNATDSIRNFSTKGNIVESALSH